MKLTRKKSIELSKEIWKWLAKTGKEKEAWPKWNKYGNIECDCFLCEYSSIQLLKNDKDNPCEYCPYYRKYHMTCDGLDPEMWERIAKTNYYKYNMAKTVKTRKKYAKLFLKELNTL